MLTGDATELNVRLAITVSSAVLTNSRISPIATGTRALTSTPVISTENVGCTTLVKLSTLLIPLSSADIRLGAPGAPGIRVLISRARASEEVAVLP